MEHHDDDYHWPMSPNNQEKFTLIGISKTVLTLGDSNILNC